LDPNPIVFQRGVQRIRAAGIDVSVGLLQEKNSALNESYIKHITSGVPFVTLKAAISLDGRMATRTGDSRWISSAETREYVHLLRGEQDAIMVGIGTILKDNSRLTVRHPHWKGKKILRVILDSMLRLPLGARILTTLDYGKLIIFTSDKASPSKRCRLEKMGVEVIEVPSNSLGLELPEVLTCLGKRGVASVLVEGGSQLHTAMIKKRLADKLFLSLSPRLIGGQSAPSFFCGEGVRMVKKSWRLRRISTFPIGDDLIIQGYF